MSTEKLNMTALNAAGFVETTVEEMLGLTPAESALIETRLLLNQALRERRKALSLSRAEVAAKIDSSQSRIAKVEAGEPSVSLDLLFRSLFAIGATPADVGRIITPPDSGEIPRN